MNWGSETKLQREDSLSSTPLTIEGYKALLDEYRLLACAQQKPIDDTPLPGLLEEANVT
jgi:hypothetical protein